jgi:hypothetical protein
MARQIWRAIISDGLHQPTLDFPVASNAAVRLQKYLEQSKDYVFAL